MLNYAQKHEKGLFFLFFLIFCQKLPKNGNFFIFGGQFSIYTHPLYLWPTFYSCGLVHQVWNVQICLKTWKRLVFLIFLDFFTKIAQKWQFFSFSVFNFFSHTSSLSVTYFFTVVDRFISFEMFDYVQKYEKGSIFLYFLIFCKKVSKNGNFFLFWWSIFFSHTPSLSVTYFFTVLDWFIRFEMLKYAQKYEKGWFKRVQDCWVCQNTTKELNSNTAMK